MENAIAFQIRSDIPIPPIPGQGPRGDCKCGGFPREGYKSCDRCLKSTRDGRLKRIAEGLCEYFGCPSAPAEGHTSCDPHLKRMLAYSLVWRKKRQEAKLCIDCGAAPQWWTQRCVMCRSKYSDGLPYGARSALKHYRRLQAIDARRQQAEDIVSLIDDDRTQRILVLRHGLNDGIDKTLEEIGTEFGVTRERIRQVERRALDRLKEDGLDVSLLRPPFAAFQRPKKRQPVSEIQRKKDNAHRLVSDAIKVGRIQKQPCRVCGRADAIAHHSDYDKPLDVEWLCRPHHMEAHGRGKGSKSSQQVPAPTGPRDARWLKRVYPDNTHYDAASIVRALRAHRLKQKAVCQATKLHSPTLNLIVRGRPVKDQHLLTVLRFVESLGPGPKHHIPVR